MSSFFITFYKIVKKIGEFPSPDKNKIFIVKKTLQCNILRLEHHIYEISKSRERIHIDICSACIE